MIAYLRRGQITILLPETDRSGAQTVIERYLPILNSGDSRIRYSILSYPEDASNPEMAMTRLEEISEELNTGV